MSSINNKIEDLNNLKLDINSKIKLHDDGVLYDLSVLIKYCANKMRDIVVDLNKKVKSGVTVGGVNEWLYDNYYLIKQLSNKSIASLKGLKGLRFIKVGTKKYPYVFFVADEFLKINDNMIDEKSIKEYIEKNNERIDFKNCELGSFVLMIKLCLIYRIYNIISFGPDKDASCLSKSMGNAISSIRFLNSFDFMDLYLELSRVNTVLLKDPSGIYEKTDTKTKLYYLQKLEHLAKYKKENEIKMADEIIKYCQKSETERQRHVGFWLLNSNVEYQQKRKSQIWYFLLMGIFWVILLSMFVLLSNDILFWVISVVVAADIIKNIANQFVIKYIHPDVIPKMDYKEGIPKEQSTLVVISALLTDVKYAQQYLDNLHQYYLCNKEKNIYFGILGDFKDSESLKKEENDRIKQILINGINNLNLEYKDMPFCLFIRGQRFNEMQKKFMGYERKRGALNELCALIMSSDKGSFDTIICNHGISNFKNIITLDADTRLLPGTAKELVKAIAHPLNKPEYNKEKTRVINGYTILQPRISIELESANKTLFTKIFCGCGGIDTYSSRTSDIYQDLFSEGIFCGKGIFNVQSFYEILKDSLPDNKILSHDLLEGSYVRTGFVSDIELLDGFPKTPISYFQRQNRWVRGDFQIIAWLFGWVKNKNGDLVKNPISWLSKFKIFDNLYRATLPIFLLAGIIYGGVLYNFLGFCLIIISLIDIFYPMLLQISKKISGHVETFRVKSDIIYGVWQKFLYCVITFCFLPFIAYDNLSALIVSFYRLLVNKNLLSWVTAQQGEQKNIIDLSRYIKIMWINLVLSIILLLFYINVFTIIISIIFLSAPLVASFISEEKKTKPMLSKQQAKVLLSYSKMMWNYFNDLANHENNYLPPDNFQEDPYNGIAYRTSPTNIGLYLLCTLCALDFSFIDKETFFERLEKTINTIEKMDKWQGHLYNWYDTKTLEVLRPKYVSTVDSGNFVGYIITLIEGIKQIDPNHEILKRLETLVDDVDFSMLFCNKKKLFYIGYNKQDEKFDNSYYDLMASEARQTSFVSIALGQVPKIHWEKLSRSLSKYNGYRGFYSWTGTMFEYFMPNLIMPVYENSMISESLLFALYCQIKNVGKNNIWGISESAYYGFDSAFNYQYKAFGVQRLALKRGMDRDLVVSPYSTFLAMIINPKVAYENLIKYLKIFQLGRYGFYEAVDFSNAMGSDGYMVVKSYMSHHLGMSILALNNVLNDNIMQKRFMQNKKMSAFSSLLEERVSLEQQDNNDFAISNVKSKPIAIKKSHVVKRIKDINCLYPKMNSLGSKVYSTVHTDSGAGFSMCNNFNVTRQDFCIENPQGIYFFAGTNQHDAIGMSFAPCYQTNVKYETKFGQYSSIFSAVSKSYHTKLEVVGGAGMPIEARKVSIKNLSSNKSDVTLAIYFEPTLTTHVADIDHRTFSNLFIETSYSDEENVLIVKRKSREYTKNDIYLVISLSEKAENIEIETRRRELFKRQSFVRDIKNLMFKQLKKDGVGSVLDPCVFLKANVKCQKGHTSVIYFNMACGENLSELIQKVKSYNAHDGFEKLKELSRTRAFAENQVSCIQETQRLMVFDVLPCMFINMPNRKFVDKYIKENKLGQDSLWKYGISGDNPIILVRLNKEEDVKYLEDYLKIFIILTLRAFKTDLIITYEEAGQYDKPIHTSINKEIEKINLSCFLHAFGGIHPINLKAINETDITLILSSANYYFDETVENAETKNNLDSISFEFKNESKEDKYIDVKNHLNLEFFNGYGGFCGDKYIISDNNRSTPLPYSYIISNNNAGAILTTGGGGFSFIDNARQNKITRWSADPLCEPSIEELKLVFKDKEESFHLSRSKYAKKSVEYSPGLVKYNLNINNINACESVYASRYYPCIIRTIIVENKGESKQDFKVLFYCRLALGVNEHATKKYIVTDFLNNKNTLIAKNKYNSEFSNNISFVYCSEKYDFTCEYTDVLKKSYDTKKIGVINDACFCLSIDVSLSAGEKKDIVILLGQYIKEKQLDNIIEHIGTPKDAYKQLNMVKAHFNDFLCKIKIDTPNKEFNKIINSFVLYQAYVCRMLAKTSFYQCGGAYGFRDQLQDCLAFLLTKPNIVRRHIIRCSAHQFIEGDVQHWWHPIKGGEKLGHKGVRTKCSDDLLWLCFTVIEYIKTTGDYEILDIQVNYIQQELLRENEHERYSIPKISDIKESIYHHCIRAINYSINFGENGLCKMRGGDWNDGMNMVGIEDKGESVWLSWFFSKILYDFSKICEYKNQKDLADEYKRRSAELVENIEKNAWDGDWYIRAFFDDGTPIGSKKSQECKIDSIAQSFGVISNPKNITDRKLVALKSAVENLYDKENKIIKLFTPPFDKTDKNPGYIKGYIKGVRENGGQYTHAAIWLCMALFLSNQNDLGFELLNTINPINHSNDLKSANKYKVEPYVLSADVYSNENFAGLGGWSWYTGAASWYYVVAVQSMLGLYVRNDKIVLRPKLPADWDCVDIEYRYKKSIYHIRINNKFKSSKVKALYIDEVLQKDKSIYLKADKPVYHVIADI